MIHIQTQLRSNRPVSKTAKSERRPMARPHGKSALGAEAEAMLRDMAFVLQLTRSLKQTLENEKTHRKEPELVNA